MRVYEQTTEWYLLMLSGVYLTLVDTTKMLSCESKDSLIVLASRLHQNDEKPCENGGFEKADLSGNFENENFTCKHRKINTV